MHDQNISFIARDDIVGQGEANEPLVDDVVAHRSPGRQKRFEEREFDHFCAFEQ